MSNCHKPGRRRQRGEMMIEALVGVLLTCLIGAGLASIASNVMNQRFNNKVEHLAMTRLAGQLYHQGVSLCASNHIELAMPTTSANMTVAVNCQKNIVNMLSVDGGPALAVSVPSRVELSVALTDPSLGIKDAKGAGTPITLSVPQRQ